MTTFILSKNKEDNRLILDTKAHGSVLGTYEGEDVFKTVKYFGEPEKQVIDKSAWQVARAKVITKDFLHLENRGWFFSLADAMKKPSSNNASVPQDGQVSIAVHQKVSEVA